MERSPIVYKLGGTSVDSTAALEQFALRLHNRSEAPVLIVVSAFAGVTDKLVALADRIGGPCQAGLLSQIWQHQQRRIHQLHLDGHEEVTAECSRIFEQLSALVARHEGDATLCLWDEILAYGERFSSVIVHAYLNEAVGKVHLLDARSLIVSDDNFGEARPLVPHSEKQLNKRLKPLLTRQAMVLTQGFCAATKDGRTTTLGRGGSDFTATWLAARLNASRVEILTDTNGVLSADPAIVPDAHTLTRLSYSQAALLARFGARVLHPHCLAPPAAMGVPLWVCNSFGPDGPTTRVGDESALSGHFSVSGLSGCTLLAYGPHEQPEPTMQQQALAFEKDQRGNTWIAMDGEHDFGSRGRKVAIIYVLGVDARLEGFSDHPGVIRQFQGCSQQGWLLAVAPQQKDRCIKVLHNQLSRMGEPVA